MNRMRLPRIALLVIALMMTFVPVALAQSSGTIFDEAGVLGDADKQEVQATFDRVHAETGDPLYAFLVPDTNVVGEPARRELLAEKARQANVPKDAGVILVAPNDRWSEVNVSKLSADSQAVYDAMLPGLRNEDYAAGLIAGAEEIQGESAGSQSGTGVSAVGLLGGILLALVAVAGGALFLRSRSRKRRELAENREAAEEEFAGLSSRMEELDERERLVGGYLEAQRPLLDQATEEKVEAMIQNASAAGFG